MKACTVVLREVTYLQYDWSDSIVETADAVT